MCAAWAAFHRGTLDTSSSRLPYRTLPPTLLYCTFYCTLLDNASFVHTNPACRQIQLVEIAVIVGDHDHGRTGLLVDSRDPGLYAEALASILDDPRTAAEMSVAAATKARSYTWSTTAARLRRLYADLTARSLVECR